MLWALAFALVAMYVLASVGLAASDYLSDGPPVDEPMTDEITINGWDAKIVRQISQAIGKAEGYYVSGSLPAIRNNPGDLKDSSGVIHRYQTVEEGFEALDRQVVRMLTGNSRYYRPDQTILDVARIYVGVGPNDAGAMAKAEHADQWAGNVSSTLGLEVWNRFTDLFV